MAKGTISDLLLETITINGALCHSIEDKPVLGTLLIKLEHESEPEPFQLFVFDGQREHPVFIILRFSELFQEFKGPKKFSCALMTFRLYLRALKGLTLERQIDLTAGTYYYRLPRTPPEDELFTALKLLQDLQEP